MNIQLATSELPAPIAPVRQRAPLGGNNGGRPQAQQKRRGTIEFLFCEYQ